ncbi:putative pectinesterase/pectinesterase inhibitor 13 [Fagus crenata]
MARFEEDIKQDEMLGNLVVMGVSLIVIAAVVIGVVAGVDNPKQGSEVSTNITLDALCNQTDYRESCLSSLEPIGNKSEVINYFKGAVNATISEMVYVLNKIQGITGVTKIPEKMALDDCVEMIELCLDDLQSVMRMVNTTPSMFYNDSSDARISLSAVISYQRTCVEGIIEGEAFFDMNRALQKSMELVSNALAIIYAFSDNDDKEADPGGVNRRSVIEEGIGEDENPEGRKLLSMQTYNIKVSQVPDAIVAKDGSGQYGRITDAINAYPNGHKGRYLIYVKSGTYKENVIIPKNKTQIFMYGDGIDNTIIAGADMIGNSYRSASLSAIGNGFICKDISIVQKIYGRRLTRALKVQSDNAVFFNCRINASISAIFALAHRQFFRDCEIQGVAAIIRGDAAVVFQRCRIIVTEPEVIVNVITAQGRSDRHESTGFVIHSCNIERDKSRYPADVKNGTALGFPLQKFSRTIIMESFLGDLISPEGWYDDDQNYGIETVTFVEYGNKGPGAQTNKRVKWPGYTVINNKNDVLRYTVGRFIQAQKWLPGTEVPFQAGLFS